MFNKTKIMRKTVLGILIILLMPQVNFAQGSRYNGSFIKSTQIRHVNKSNFIIEGLEFSATDSDCIALYDCENVIIRNCKFGPSPSQRGIYLFKCKNVTIMDCTFGNTQSGLVASTSQGIKFEYNDLTNIVGPLEGGKKIGVMAQFIEVYGAENSVSYNVCENFEGKSAPEDLVNMYSSNGTPSSPIRINSNWIRGGGPSSSGGGINLGDGGGSYQIAENNILVDPGQYGVGISGGNNMTLKNNKVFGKRQFFSNVGITACNWYEKIGKSFNITISNNEVNYTHRDGYRNNFWVAGNMGTINGSATNKYNPSLNESILPEKIIGRARSSTNIKEYEEINDPLISIYLDNKNFVCVNFKGEIVSGASISIVNSNGEEVAKSNMTAYHSVVHNNSLTSGDYMVEVNNGQKKYSKKIIIP